MKDFIDFLFNGAPWLQPVLAWSIGFLAVFLILTAPAYFVLLPFFKGIKKELAAYVDGLARRREETSSTLTERLDSAADEFLKDGGLWRLHSQSGGSSLIGTQLRVLKKLRKPISNTVRSLEQVHKKVSALQKDLQQSKVAEVQALPALPEPEVLAKSAGTHRVAWLTLIMVGTIVIGIMFVNTGMLSQILRDLGVVPAALAIAGIPLAYVFAFILTLVEAGLGIAHGSARSENPDKLSILPTIITLFAMIMACVEGFFYSRIAPSTGTFSLPFLSYEMPQSNFYFFWGFVLVMTLFILGFKGFEACATVLRGTESDTLLREMSKLGKHHERYARDVTHSQETLEEVKGTASSADYVLQGPAINSESVRQQLESVLDALNGPAPEWAKDKNKEVALTRTEVNHLAQMGGVWLGLATLGIAVMAITSMNNFEVFYPGLKPLMVWVLVVGHAALFCGVGFLLNVGETVVQGGENERRVWAGPQLSRWGAYVVGGLLIVTYVALFFTVAWPLGAVWFLNLLVGLFLVAVSYQLSPLLNVVRLFLRRLWGGLAGLLEGLWLRLMQLLHGVIWILEGVSLFLAMPLHNMVNSRREMAEKSRPGRVSSESGIPSGLRLIDVQSAPIVGNEQHVLIEPVETAMR